MAPEVCLEQVATPASDQYSLACMAYELLTGRTPFEGDASMLRQAHVHDVAVPLEDLAPHVSAEVATAITKGLAKDPDRRHRDVRAMVRATRGSAQAFDKSQELTRVMRMDPAETVAHLSTQHGMDDSTISRLMDIDRTEVVRLRRRQARSALVGRRPR